MTLGHQFTALDRPAKGGHGEHRDASEEAARHAEFRQPDRRLKIERCILVRARRDLATTVKHLAGEEGVSRHGCTVRYSLVTVNGLRRRLNYGGQG